jgi:hypothetical protein
MSMKSHVAVALTVLAALTGQSAFSAGNGSASDTSEKTQEVTVTARRAELAARVSKFVDQITVTENQAGIARWRQPVCPSVSGLPREAGEFVLGRFSEIARAAAVPLAGEHCHPNLFVVVSPRPAELLQAMEKRNFQFAFGVDASPTVVDELITTPRPVRVWYTSLMEDRWGMPVVCTAFGHPAPCHSEASHLLFNAVYVFGRVFVIVDLRRLDGVTRGQFADYVAMVGMAKLKPDARLGDASTILKLFDGAHQAAPPGLTDWDQTFLKSLYVTEQASTKQRSAIAHQMVRDIAP